MPRPHSTRRFAPKVEPLEDRATPASHTWDSGGTTDNWSEDANWAADDGPAVGETDVTIVYNTAATSVQDIAGLRVETVTFDDGSAVTLTLNSNLTLDGAGATDTLVDRTGLNIITGNGNLVLTGAAASVVVDLAGSGLEIAADIVGTQGVTKSGAGVLTFSTATANTYAGVTTIENGELFVNTNTASAGVSRAINVGDGLGLEDTAVLRLVNSFELPNLADITVEDDGLFAVDGTPVENVSDLTLNGGEVSIAGGAELRLLDDIVTVGDSAGGALISGDGTLELDFNVATATTFDVGDGGAARDFEISATVNDAFSFGVIKSGPGRMILSGTNDYGSTRVTEGELAVDGSQPGGPVTVTAGELGGGGSVGTVTVTGGTLSPGASGGVTNSTGVLTGSRLTALTATVTDAGYETAVFTGLTGPAVQNNSNVLAVTGTVTLTNVTLNLARIGSASVVGRQYLTILNDGTDPIVGTFNGIAEGGSLVVDGQTFFVSYVAGDGNDVAITAGTVDPSINQPPIAVADSSATPPGVAVLIPVLANDTDPNGDVLRIATVAQPTSGIAIVQAGQVLYTPNSGFVGTDSFTYTVTDGRGGTSSATVTVSVTEGPLPNRGPLANPDSVATAPGTAVRIPVLANDSDLDNDTLTPTVLAADQSPNGTAVANADGTITFTPNPGFTGTTSFTYTISDGRDGEARAVVTVTVRAGGGGLGRQIGVGLDRGGNGTVRLVNPDRTTRSSSTPFTGAQQSGVRTAAVDFNGDGVADLVVGTGPNGVSRVRVLDGVTQNELFSIQPFEDRFTGGVYVAAGDITGDGIADLVITPDEGGGPRVRVFSGRGFVQVADFFGIDDANFRGGARASIGDINGDGVGDLLVAAGFGGGPRVAGFDGTGLVGGAFTRKLFPDFFAFEEGLRNGAYVAAGDVDGNGSDDLIAGGGPGGGPRVTVFSGSSLVGGGRRQLANFFSGNTANRGGVRVAAKDLDGDAFADIVTGAGPGSGSRVTAYAGSVVNAASVPAELFSFEAQPGFTGGVFVG